MFRKPLLSQLIFIHRTQVHTLLLMNPLPFLSSLPSHSATNTRNSPDHTWARNRPTSVSVTSPRNSSPPDRPSSDCKPAPTRVPPRPARIWAPVVKSSSESNFPDGRTDGLDVLISFTNGQRNCVFIWVSFGGKDLVNLLLYREAQIGDPREMKKKPALINHFLFAFNGVSVVVIDIVDLCLAILDRLVRNLNDRKLKLIQNLNTCNILNMFTMSITGSLTLLPIKCIRINGNQSMNG